MECRCGPHALRKLASVTCMKYWIRFAGRGSEVSQVCLGASAEPVSGECPSQYGTMCCCVVCFMLCCVCCCLLCRLPLSLQAHSEPVHSSCGGTGRSHGGAGGLGRASP